MTTILSDTETNQSAATARPRLAGGGLRELLTRGWLSAMVVGIRSGLLSAVNSDLYFEFGHVCAPWHRKFIGGTPEQWDGSKPVDEDPDASADLQPILVSEQVCAWLKVRPF